MSILKVLDQNGDTEVAWRPVEVDSALVADIETAFPMALALDAWLDAKSKGYFAVKSDDVAGLVNAELVHEFPATHQGAVILSRQLVGG